jgi:EpsI family protein
MITRRLLSVQCVLLGGFSIVFLLPQTIKTSPMGIALTLPNVVGNWSGDDLAVTKREREVLSKDTEFARKVYTDSERDQILVSIVLSGEDMTSSIHRPERCLPAQGWNVESSVKRAIELPGGKSLELTRLQNGQLFVAPDKRRVTLHSLDYYWFVGYKDMTASHLVRTGIDLRDRVLHGFNQRWAYVTVAAIVTQGIQPPERTGEQTAEMLEAFIRDLVPHLQKPDGSPLL